MIQGIKDWLCKKYGHRFSEVDYTIFLVEYHAISFGGMLTLNCSRCGRNIFPEIVKDYEEKHGHKPPLPEGARY